MPDLATIGYEGTTIESVITALKDARIGLLIDVRAVAQSRKPGFSKRQLGAALDESRIGYVHLQGLGTPKPRRDAVRAGHPERIEVIFREHMTHPTGRGANWHRPKFWRVSGRRACCASSATTTPVTGALSRR
jgi:hypothetical protein